MKRIFCIVLSLAVLISCMVIPTFAVEEIVDPGPQVFNLLDSYGYYMYYGDSFDIESTMRSFSVNAYDPTDSSTYIDYFSVSPILPVNVLPDDDGNVSNYGEPVYVNFLDFVFLCSSIPDQINLEYYDSYGFNRAEAEFYDTYFSPESNVYYIYCTFDVSNSMYTDITLSFRLSEPLSYLYYESIALYRDGFQKRIQPFMTLNAYGTAKSEDDNSFFQEHYFSDVTFIPGDDINLNGNNSYIRNPPVDDRLSVFIEFDNGGYAGAGKFTMSMVTTGVFDNYYDYGSATEAGMSFTDSTGVTYNIPINTYFTKAEGLAWYGLPLYYVTFTGDLSMYDLTDGELTLNFVVNGRYPYEGVDFVDYFFRVESVFFYYGYNESSSELDQFFNRLTNWWFLNFYQPLHIHFSGLELKIQGFFQNLETYIGSRFDFLVSSLNSFFANLDTNLNSKFDSLFAKLQEYFGVPPDTAPPDQSEQQQGIQDSIGDMEDIAGEFEGAGYEIEQLMPDMPSYEDTGLGELSTQATAHIVQLRAVFVVLWDNKFIIQLLTFSCLLALGGFILFGER